MLPGCTKWAEDVAKRYRDLGYWQGVTLSDLLARAIRRAPDKAALIHGGERITYRTLGESVDRLACGFIRAGIKPLDRVVVQLPNVPEFVYTYFALARIGAMTSGAPRRVELLAVQDVGCVYAAGEHAERDRGRGDREGAQH